MPRPTLALAVLAVGALAASGCGTPRPDVPAVGDDGLVVCTGTGGPSVVIEVRGPDGQPAAFGATIVVRDGAFADTSDAARPWSELYLGAGERRPGTYDVRVTKPGYRPVTLRGVVARPTGDPRCGYSEPRGPQRRVRLRLRPGAPPVRSVVVVPDAIAFGLPYLEEPLRAIVDADPGVSQGVRWSSSDTTVATVSASGVLRSECRARHGEAVITAESVADPRVRAATEVSVGGLRSEDDLRGVGPPEVADRARECLRRLGGGR